MKTLSSCAKKDLFYINRFMKEILVKNFTPIKSEFNLPFELLISKHTFIHARIMLPNLSISMLGSSLGFPVVSKLAGRCSNEIITRSLTMKIRMQKEKPVRVLI